MDGCTSLQILRRVFLPLVLPGMVTVALFAFITSWNEFIAALIFMSKETSFTVPVMLTGVSHRQFGAVDWGALQAGRDRLDHPLPADLPAAAALLRRRPPERRGEVDATRPPRPPAAGPPDDPRRRASPPGSASAPSRRRSTIPARLAPETRDRIIRARRRARLPPERPRAVAAPRPELHRRAHLQRQLRPLHPADHGGRSSASSPTAASASSCATPPTTRSASASIIEQLMGKRVDGLIFTARRADRRPAIGVPLGDLPALFVFSHGADDDDASASCPTTSRARASPPSTSLAAGRRRIAHVTGPEHFEAVRLRRDGWRAALAAAGLADGPATTCTGRLVRGLGPRGRRPRSSPVRPTAPTRVFAGNDQIARGLLDGAARPRPRACRGDVAVVGFDNWDVMVEARPPAPHQRRHEPLRPRAGGGPPDHAADRRRGIPRRPAPALHPRRCARARRRRAEPEGSP